MPDDDDEKCFCLACGKARPKPKAKKLTRDYYGRIVTFCDDRCREKYATRQPKA